MTDPLVSAIMPTYQAEKYVRAALRSALAQDYRPLEIVVSDDASKDATFDIVRQEVAAYDGPHAVLVNRNETNLVIANWNKLWSMASGELIVEFHNDDVANPDRVSVLARAWRDTGVSVLSSNAREIDEAGADTGELFDSGAAYNVDLASLVETGWTPATKAATLAYDRAVIDRFGDLDPEQSVSSTDWIIPFRGALLNGVRVLNEHLLSVRRHGESGAQQAFFTQADARAVDEALFAEGIVQRLYLLYTLDDWMLKHPDDPRLKRHYAKLVEKILYTARDWRSVRNALMRARYRPTWQPLD